MNIIFEGLKDLFNDDIKIEYDSTEDSELYEAMSSSWENIKDYIEDNDVDIDKIYFKNDYSIIGNSDFYDDITGNIETEDDFIRNASLLPLLISYFGIFKFNSERNNFTDKKTYSEIKENGAYGIVQNSKTVTFMMKNMKNFNSIRTVPDMRYVILNGTEKKYPSYKIATEKSICDFTYQVLKNPIFYFEMSGIVDGNSYVTYKFESGDSRTVLDNIIESFSNFISSKHPGKIGSVSKKNEAFDGKIPFDVEYYSSPEMHAYFNDSSKLFNEMRKKLISILDYKEFYESDVSSIENSDIDFSVTPEIVYEFINDDQEDEKEKMISNIGKISRFIEYFSIFDYSYIEDDEYQIYDNQIKSIGSGFCIDNNSKIINNLTRNFSFTKKISFGNKETEFRKVFEERKDGFYFRSENDIIEVLSEIANGNNATFNLYDESGNSKKVKISGNRLAELIKSTIIENIFIKSEEHQVEINDCTVDMDDYIGISIKYETVTSDKKHEYYNAHSLFNRIVPTFKSIKSSIESNSSLYKGDDMSIDHKQMDSIKIKNLIDSLTEKEKEMSEKEFNDCLSVLCSTIAFFGCFEYNQDALKDKRSFSEFSIYGIEKDENDFIIAPEASKLYSFIYEFYGTDNEFDIIDVISSDGEYGLKDESSFKELIKKISNDTDSFEFEVVERSSGNSETKNFIPKIWNGIKEKIIGFISEIYDGITSLSIVDDKNSIVFENIKNYANQKDISIEYRNSHSNKVSPYYDSAKIYKYSKELWSNTLDYISASNGKFNIDDIDNNLHNQYQYEYFQLYQVYDQLIQNTKLDDINEKSLNNNLTFIAESICQLGMFDICFEDSNSYRIYGEEGNIEDGDIKSEQIASGTEKFYYLSKESKQIKFINQMVENCQILLNIGESSLFSIDAKDILLNGHITKEEKQIGFTSVNDLKMFLNTLIIKGNGSSDNISFITCYNSTEDVFTNIIYSVCVNPSDDRTSFENIFSIVVNNMMSYLYDEISSIKKIDYPNCIFFDDNREYISETLESNANMPVSSTRNVVLKYPNCEFKTEKIRPAVFYDKLINKTIELIYDETKKYYETKDVKDKSSITIKDVKKNSENVKKLIDIILSEKAECSVNSYPKAQDENEESRTVLRKGDIKKGKTITDIVYYNFTTYKFEYIQKDCTIPLYYKEIKDESRFSSYDYNSVVNYVGNGILLKFAASLFVYPTLKNYKNNGNVIWTLNPIDQYVDIDVQLDGTSYTISEFSSFFKELSKFTSNIIDNKIALALYDSTIKEKAKDIIDESNKSETKLADYASCRIEYARTEKNFFYINKAVGVKKAPNIPFVEIQFKVPVVDDAIISNGNKEIKYDWINVASSYGDSINTECSFDQYHMSPGNYFDSLELTDSGNGAKEISLVLKAADGFNLEKIISNSLMINDIGIAIKNDNEEYMNNMDMMGSSDSFENISNIIDMNITNFRVRFGYRDIDALDSKNTIKTDENSDMEFINRIYLNEDGLPKPVLMYPWTEFKITELNTSLVGTTSDSIDTFNIKGIGTGTYILDNMYIAGVNLNFVEDGSSVENKGTPFNVIGKIAKSLYEASGHKICILGGNVENDTRGLVLTGYDRTSESKWSTIGYELESDGNSDSKRLSPSDLDIDDCFFISSTSGKLKDASSFSFSENENKKTSVITLLDKLTEFIPKRFYYIFENNNRIMAGRLSYEDVSILCQNNDKWLNQYAHKLEKINYQIIETRAKLEGEDDYSDKYFIRLYFEGPSNSVLENSSVADKEYLRMYNYNSIGDSVINSLEINNNGPQLGNYCSAITVLSGEKRLSFTCKGSMISENVKNADNGEIWHSNKYPSAIEEQPYLTTSAIKIPVSGNSGEEYDANDYAKQEAMNYFTALSNQAYTGSMNIIGDPFYYFDSSIEPAKYEIYLNMNRTEDIRSAKKSKSIFSGVYNITKITHSISGSGNGFNYSTSLDIAKRIF